ncbi:MAG: hypothetical protein FWG35_06170, partial [Spirochaetaceae bacterium]|nr:hypothetical protein [Spirochaetaceae bacterium]
GILDRENPALVFPSPDNPLAGRVDILSGETSWQAGVVRIPASERNRLTQVRAVRFIVKKEAAGPNGSTRGRILVGKLVFEGSSLSPRVQGNGSLRLREIPEALADGYAPPSLRQVFREPLETFHSRDSSPADQRVLEAAWKDIGTAPADSWEIRTFTTAIPPKNYRSFNLFMRVADIQPWVPTPSDPDPPAKMKLSYTDAQGKGIHLEFAMPAADNVWKKLSVDIPGRRASFGGVPLTTTFFRIDSDSEDLNRFSMRFENSGGSSGAKDGTVYIDEVYLSDPRDTLSFAGSAEMSLYLPGDVISVGGVSILKNVAISEKISGRSEDFKGQKEQAEATDFSMGAFNSASLVSGELLGFAFVEGEFAVNALEDRTEYEAGHSIRFPSEGGVVIVRDQYKRNYGTLLPAMSRSSSIESSGLGRLRLSAATETYLASGSLAQNWYTQGNLSSAQGSSFSARLSLRHMAEDYSLDENASYGSSWVSAYKLMLPWTEGRGAERQANLRMDGNIAGESVSLIVNPEASFVNTGERDGRQRNTNAVSLELPLVFRDSPHDPGWRLTFLYSRRATTTTEVPEKGNYEKDTRVLGEAIQRQEFFYNSLPFAEIFMHSRNSSFAGDTNGLVQGEYTPQAGLRYSRSYGSYLWNLVIPSQAELRAKKTFTRGGEVLSALNTYEVSLTNFAVNLFGSQGAYPFFSWYNVDEFQIVNSFSVIKKEDEKDLDWSATFHQIVNFTKEETNQILLDHTVTMMRQNEEFSYRGAGAFKYVWRSQMARDFGIGYLEKSREAGSYYQHTEKIELTYTQNRGLTAYLVAGHETALTLRKGSFIKADANLGFGVERDYSGLPPGYKILFGLSLGISAHFIF